VPTNDQGIGPDVILIELEGFRRVALTPTESPVAAGVAIGAKMRSTVTWYPGATQACVQLHGTEEEPISFRVVLRDQWIGLVNGAQFKLQELRNLLNDGVRLQLVWGENLSRRGYLTRVRPIYEREADIMVEVEFTVDEADEAIVFTRLGIAPLPAPPDIFDALDAISAAADTAIVAAATITSVVNAVT